MKKYSAPILGLFLVLGIMAKPAAAQFGRPGQDRNGDRVCVYRDNNFNGNAQCFSPGDEVSDIKNSEISSIRIYGRANVVVYEDRNFRGDSRQFTSDTPDLAQISKSGDRSWNDRVGSMRITSDSGRYSSNRDRDNRDDGRYGYPSQQAYRDSVCVYENPNFQGRSECWQDGAQMPNLANWSDKISSIRVTGNARVMVYRDIRFQGDRQLIDRDMPNLPRNWNDQISSLEVQSRNSNRGWGFRR